MMQRNHQGAEAACREALLQMGQGKLLQPRRLLEAALRDDPNHVPTRIALVELAILEDDPVRAVREANITTGIAVLRCREEGLSHSDLAGHPTGMLLLRALHVSGRAHLAARDTREAINAFAAVLHEDSEDRLGVCTDLIGVFVELGKPEGVLGLYRLGYTHGMNLLDVVFAALGVGAYEAAFKAIVEALESAPPSRFVFENLLSGCDATNPAARNYLQSRRGYWERLPAARVALRRMLLHPIVQRTFELLDELDDDDDADDDDLDETKAQLIANLRNEQVVKSVLQRLAE